MQSKAKRAYQRPTFVKRDALAAIAAIVVS